MALNNQAKLRGCSQSLYQASGIQHLLNLEERWDETDGTEITRHDEELPVLMIYKTKEERDVKTKYFDEDGSCRKRMGIPTDNDSEEIQPSM